MFFGSYEHSLDEKGRLLIPRKIKEGLKGFSNLYVMQGFEGCLAIYTEEEFKRLTEECNKLSFYKKNSRDYLRLMLASVYELNVDKVGRVQLPAQILEKYEISREVLIIGVNDHFEIWDRNTYPKYEKEANDRFEEIAESLVKENEWAS